jgi:hypothetical protein
LLLSIIDRERAMQTAGAHELAYANTALINALMEMLVQRNVMTWSDLRSIAYDAVEAMRPMSHVVSIGAAIRYIEEAIVPQINERTPR